MKQKEKIAISSLVVALMPFIAFAQGTVRGIFEHVRELLGWAIGIIFIIATLVFLWGIVQFIAKGDDEEARKKARGLMTWGIIGMAVMVAAWGIANAIVVYFGLGGGLPNLPAVPGISIPNNP